MDLVVAASGNEVLLVHNKGPGGGCLIEGSKVAMSDGTTRDIERIRVGDKVRGFNVKTGKWETYTVTELQSEENMMGFYVVNKKLRVSPAHHVLVNGERKVPSEIELNDILIDGGKETMVTSLEYFDQKADRYNIVLGRNKDIVFVVDDILVWNGW